ncbi:MAG: MFS transporter [Candidatus Margulisiibacteriota bacterium]
MEDHVVRDRRQQFWLIAIISAISFLITLDYNSLNISLPSIANSFGVKVGVVSWLPTLYLLTITGTLLGFGKLGDMKGYKLVLCLGLGLFALGGLACALAPTFPALLAARVFQSLGQAMYSPICIAMLTTFLPTDMKGKALGLYATFQGLGLASGPALGGLMNSLISWRGVFLFTAPLALLILLAAVKLLPSKQPPARETRFDLLGAIVLLLGMAAILYALNQGIRVGWTDPLILACLLTFLAAFGAFFLREKSCAYPLLDLNLFRNLNFTFAVLAAFIALGMHIGNSFLFPFYLQMMRHLSVGEIGLLAMVPSVMMMLLAPFAGNLSDRYGSRYICLAGMGLAAAAFALYFCLSPDSNIYYIAGAMFLLGSGMGLFIAPNNKLIMAQAPADKQGVASGVYKIALNAGSSVGIAFYMLVLAQVVLFDIAKMNIMLNQVRQHTDVMMAGFRGAFLFGLSLALLGMLLCYLAKDKTPA